MKVAFIYGSRLSSKLTKFFTGSTCYHVGFTDGDKFWDMNLLFRRRNWLGLYSIHDVILVECPVKITAEYLNYILDTSKDKYGVLDYLLFALRPIYHLFGQSTRNAGGKICSEMVADIMISQGWQKQFAEVPSPADLEVLIIGHRDAITLMQ